MTKCFHCQVIEAEIFTCILLFLYIWENGCACTRSILHMMKILWHFSDSKLSNHSVFNPTVCQICCEEIQVFNIFNTIL